MDTSPISGLASADRVPHKPEPSRWAQPPGRTAVPLTVTEHVVTHRKPSFSCYSPPPLLLGSRWLSPAQGKTEPHILHGAGLQSGLPHGDISLTCADKEFLHLVLGADGVLHQETDSFRSLSDALQPTKGTRCRALWRAVAGHPVSASPFLQ